MMLESLLKQGTTSLDDLDEMEEKQAKEPKDKREDGVVCEEYGWEMNIYMVYVCFGPNFYDQCN